MRSEIGTKSRLAAHILAFILLIAMLIYTEVPQSAVSPADPLPDVPRAEAVSTAIAERPETPPAADRPGALETGADTGATVRQDGQASLSPGAGSEQSPEKTKPSRADDAPAGLTTDAPAALPAETPGDAPEPAPPADGENAGPVPPVAQTEDEPAAMQPDEKGALVVAAADSGAEGPVAAAMPLANANLEVLGDGFYWIDSRHDLEKELAAIPEIGMLILFAPLPGHRADGFEHVKTEVIPADSADLSRDAAERFLHLVATGPKPVVAAVLPWARGAAYFKGAYLLSSRNAGIDETLIELEPELEKAGDLRDEIVHRLRRLED